MTAMTLPLRRKTAALALRYDDGVAEFRRNPEVLRVRHRARTSGATMAHHNTRSLPAQRRRPGCEDSQEAAYLSDLLTAAQKQEKTNHRSGEC